jgi:hypothetical protein
VSERSLYASGMTQEERDELILSHLPLLKHIAGRMALDLPASVDREDLYGYGMVGLIQAARRSFAAEAFWCRPLHMVAPRTLFWCYKKHKPPAKSPSCRSLSTDSCVRSATTTRT